MRAALIWGTLVCAIAIPLIAAAQSPLLAWRQPIYIAAGFAGVAGLALMLLQPLLAKGVLPGLTVPRGRKLHRWIGGTLVLAIVVHVAGLWITSPPDVIDALSFRSPTPFSVWGVIAMWASFAAAALAAVRRRIPPKRWRPTHKTLTLVVVTSTVIHAMLIEGTMEPISKALLCTIVMAAAIWAIRPIRPNRP